MCIGVGPVYISTPSSHLPGPLVRARSQPIRSEHSSPPACVCVCFSRKRKNLGRLSQERERQNNKKDHHHHQRKKKRDVNVNLATLTRERKRESSQSIFWNFFFLVGRTLCAAVIVFVTTPPNHLTLERKRDNMWNVRFISAPNGN